jgi:hypothetical protein
METAIDRLSHSGGVVRPTHDIATFLVILQRGFNFSAANTSAWSFEDWETAVDAVEDDEDCGVAPAVGPDILNPQTIPETHSRFVNHGIWTLFALAYLRGRGAYQHGISKTARPFRSLQIAETNVPDGDGDTLSVHFRNGFDDALADAVAGGDRTPDWVKQAVRAPLLRSREERRMVA